MPAKVPRTLSAFLLLAFLPSALPAADKAPGLYWFLPDGMRADIGGKDIFELAAEGKLPNIKKLMENGSYGYSLPVYPAHTPTNFATLMTGCWPELHGVADGQMRLEGFGLARPSISGFSSTSKKVPPAWKILEDAGKSVVVVSVPGSTPPDISAGVTIRGRWGSWGSDFWAVNFETRVGTGTAAASDTRLFFMGPQLTQGVPAGPAAGWSGVPASYSPPIEMELAVYGTTVYAYVYDASDDKTVNYSGAFFSFDKNSAIADLHGPASWSVWFPVTLKWRESSLPSSLRVSLIRLEPSGLMKARLLFDPLNRTTVQPADAAAGITKGAGPMVDFPDNWPAQLNNYPEEKDVFFSEAKMALDWHRSLVPYVYSALKPDIFIQDTYTPNQMLESRWWTPRVDAGSARYASFTPEERAAARADLEEMYKKLDDIIGEALKNAGANTLIALSSDHGIAPLNRYVRLNNLFAKEGLLKFNTDPATGDPAVDWANTKAAHLKMIGVYLRPDNLAGKWQRGSGPEYEALRDKAITMLTGLRDGNIAPIERVIKWENADELRMPKDRVPDLLLVMKPGYGLTEEMSADLEVFRDAKEGGYKQALDGGKSPALRTPFVIAGPGVKKNHKLASDIGNADQLPTLLKLLGVPVPEHMQGKVITELVNK